MPNVNSWQSKQNISAANSNNSRQQVIYNECEESQLDQLAQSDLMDEDKRQLPDPGQGSFKMASAAAAAGPNARMNLLKLQFQE